MATTSARHIARNALGLFIGVTVPLVGYFVITTPLDSERGLRGAVSSQSEQGPGELVAGILPQVAVMGHREGPGGTREVMIQVPGVPGPQSVFILPDGETMIAGRVVDSGISAYGIAPKMLSESGVGPLESGVVGAADNAVAASANVRKVTGAPVVAESDIPLPPISTPHEPVSVPDWLDGERQNADLVRAIAERERSEDVTTPVREEPEQVSELSNDAPGALVSASLEDAVDLTTQRDFQAALQDTVAENDMLIHISGQTDHQAQQDAYYDGVVSLPAISQGDGDKDLYIFFDPNCPICHALYKELAADVTAGDVTVHWIPSVVFADRRSSIVSSARLVEGVESGEANMERELARVMTRDGYTDTLSEGFEDTNSEALQNVVINTAMMAVARPETPLLIFQGTNGVLNIERGIPAPGIIDRISERRN